MSSPLHPCEVTSVGRMFNTVSMIFGLQKNSSFRPMLDYYLVKLKETGFTAKVLQKYLKTTDSELFCHVELTSSLALEPLFGLFLLLAIASIGSVVVCLGEASFKLLSTRTQPKALPPRDEPSKACHDILKMVKEATLSREEVATLINVVGRPDPYTRTSAPVNVFRRAHSVFAKY